MRVHCATPVKRGGRRSRRSACASASSMLWYTSRLIAVIAGAERVASNLPKGAPGERQGPSAFAIHRRSPRCRSRRTKPSQRHIRGLCDRRGDEGPQHPWPVSRDDPRTKYESPAWRTDRLQRVISEAQEAILQHRSSRRYTPCRTPELSLTTNRPAQPAWARL